MKAAACGARRSVRRAFLLLVCTLCIGGMAACSDGEHASRSNSRDHRNEKPQLEVIWELRLPDGSLPFLAVLRSDSELVVVDDAERLPYALSAGGKRRRLLAKGSGPGEVASAVALATGPGGQVALLDGVQRRLHVLDGRDSLRTDLRLDVGVPMGVHWPDDAERLWVRGAMPGTVQGTTLYRVDLVTATISPRAAAPIRAINAADPEARAVCLYCPSAVSADSLLVGVRGDSTYLLVAFEADGVPKWEWQHPNHPVARFAQADVDSAVQERERTIAELGLRRFAGFQPSALPALPQVGQAMRAFLPSGFGFDSSGGLWVVPPARYGDSASLHFFASPGDVPNEWKLPPGTRLFHAHSDRLLLARQIGDTVSYSVLRITHGR